MEYIQKQTHKETSFGYFKWLRYKHFQAKYLKPQALWLQAANTCPSLLRVHEKQNLSILQLKNLSRHIPSQKLDVLLHVPFVWQFVFGEPRRINPSSQIWVMKFGYTVFSPTILPFCNGLGWPHSTAKGNITRKNLQIETKFLGLYVTNSRGYSCEQNKRNWWWRWLVKFD